MYKVILTHRAAKQIKALSKKMKTKVKEKLIRLQHDPFEGDVKKMKLEPFRYRLRIGDYRVIFDIDKKTITIFILNVKHRKDVYR